MRDNKIVEEIKGDTFERIKESTNLHYWRLGVGNNNFINLRILPKQNYLNEGILKN